MMSNHTNQNASRAAAPGGRRLAAAAMLAWAADASPTAAAEAPQSALTLRAAHTLDVWRNLAGGAKPGGAVLNKVQVFATLDGGSFERPGFRAHLEYFYTAGDAVSGPLVGDIQGLDNIEAPSTHRLFEAWVEQSISDRAVVRAGLMDLNAEFDSIEPAGAFINSSHGIGTEIAKSGRNGPSIFPVSAVGLQARVAASKTVSLGAAVFDGVPGDPARPVAPVAVRLARHDGALLIGQADLALASEARASLGAWRYTASAPRLDGGGDRPGGYGGGYASLQGPAPWGNDLSGWVRVGWADKAVVSVMRSVSAGMIWRAPFDRREQDLVGLAVSRASLSPAARAGGPLPRAETTFELTYQYRLRPWITLQPDLQIVVNPATAADLRNATVFGLRVSLTSPVRDEGR